MNVETLICTVKNSEIIDDVTVCSVFILNKFPDSEGKKLYQYRDSNKVGVWLIRSFGLKTHLTRVSGNVEIEQCDALYGDMEMSEKVVSVTPQQRVLVFEGKNWKLASEKKWREKELDTTGFEEVGDSSFKGKAHKILKGPSCFVAIPVS